MTRSLQFGKKGEAARAVGEGARAGRKDGVGMGKSGKGKSKTAAKGGAKGGPKGKGGKR